MTNPTDKKCMCGEPWTKGVNHQTDKPCYLQPRNSLHSPIQCKQKDDLVDITPSPNSASGWEKNLELGGDIIDFEGDLRPDGIERLKRIVREIEQAAREEERAFIGNIKRKEYMKGFEEGANVEQRNLVSILGMLDGDMDKQQISNFLRKYYLISNDK